jgi:hypothetical protein
LAERPWFWALPKWPGVIEAVGPGAVNNDLLISASFAYTSAAFA